MAYKSPLIDEIPFKFTDAGYESPNFENLNFYFESLVKDLSAAIQVMQFERDYLKSCKTYVVGYSQYNIQILKQNCIYGGIRDLEAYLNAVADVKNLPAYLKSVFPQQLDIVGFIKGMGLEQSDLSSIVKGLVTEAPFNLPAYIKFGLTSAADISTYLHTCFPDSSFITSSIRGWSRANTVTLPEEIKGWAKIYVNFPEYIKANFYDFADLTLDIFKIWTHTNDNIISMIHGWAETNLTKTIRAFSYDNLHLNIRATYLYNLVAVMVAVSPVDLAGALHGWAFADISSSITYSAGPGDLAVHINSSTPKDLSVVLNAFLAIETPVDLSVSLQSYYTTNLIASLLVTPAVDLSASLTPRGYSLNLGAIIYPKVVYVRTILTLSYLESIDLAASVNPNCFNSSYIELAVQVYSMHSKNLPVSIFGTDGSNISDLLFFINADNYYEEDKFKLRIFKEPIQYTSLILKSSNLDTYTEIDTIKLVTAPNRYEAQLGASIVGTYLEVDLGMVVLPYTPRSYEASGLKETFIVLKLTHSSVEEWHRYVEVTFDKYVRSYYYFSGNQQVYREFTDDQWIIQVKGYSTNNLPSGIDRIKINRKYVFNLKQYSSIDAAIKDMTARVTMLRESDLSCILFAEPKKEIDLSVSIASRVVYKSNRVLPISIVVDS